MNKRRSESFNRSTVYLGHPFATLPSTNMLKINQHTTTLSKALLTAGLLGGAALSTLGAGSALAGGREDCRFGGSQSMQHPLCSSSTVWILGDKKLTNLTFNPTIPADGPPSGDFSFIWDEFGAPGYRDDEWTTLAVFDPSLTDPTSGSYSYDLEIINSPLTFETVELDVDHSGSGQTVTKAVTGIPDLISIDGMPVGPVPLSGTFISVTDSWTLDPNTGTIMAISNTYTQTPAPLPILGAGVAFGSIRKLRKLSARLKTFSMG